VKQCGRCGTERGPLLVNKLYLVLSDRSGAAEDLAGAAIQLAASAWLRRERASGWGSALIDEPFGALDASNRRAFAVHLTVMLRRYGFEQSFIVSHSADTVGMLPGRIVVDNVGGRATVRVVA
jgi:DNA repair exonuclease SbcCD ATPase subunit